MLNDGGAVLVPTGTEVEVIDESWSGTEIQFVSGPLQGQEAYTFLNALTTSNPG